MIARREFFHPASLVHYYFDIRDNEILMVDDVGVDLPSFEAARKEAARALAEVARDERPGVVVRLLSVEVRDEMGPVLKATLRFEAERASVGVQKP